MSVVVPAATPLTLKLNVVAPAGTETVAGTVAMLLDPVASVTVSPPAGAGSDNVIVVFTELLGATRIDGGNDSSTPRVRTDADVVPNPSALALTVVVPIATPVTTNVAVVCPALTTTCGGTETNAEFPLFKATATPLAGATSDSATVIERELPTATTPDCGVNEMLGGLTTSTIALVVPKPAPLAVIVLLPSDNAVTAIVVV